LWAGQLLARLRMKRPRVTALALEIALLRRTDDEQGRHEDISLQVVAPFRG